MKIGIIGDTHGSIQALRRVMQAAPPVEHWFHTGDYAHDANWLAKETRLPVARVCGNCDSWENRAKPDVYMELLGLKIWLTHGNRYLRNGGVPELAWWGHKLGMDIVIFGHTHEPLVQEDKGLLLLNPGSPALPRGGYGPSFAVLTLKAATPPSAELFEIAYR